MSPRNMSPDTSSYQRIYAAVRRIPPGRVATYGQIAALAGLPGHARQVGYALHALKSGSGVPWHRVINAQGMISLRTEFGGHQIQREMLEEEGGGVRPPGPGQPPGARLAARGGGFPALLNRPVRRPPPFPWPGPSSPPTYFLVTIDPEKD